MGAKQCTNMHVTSLAYDKVQSSAFLNTEMKKTGFHITTKMHGIAERRLISQGLSSVELRQKKKHTGC